MSMKVEFNCQMINESDVQKIKDSINQINGVNIESYDLKNEKVILNINPNCKSINELQNFLEKETGIRIVVKGVGEHFSAVSEIRNSILGIIRLSQSTDNTCFVDGFVSNTKLSKKDNHCCVNIHEYGDLRGNNYENVGDVYIKISKDIKPNAGKFKVQGKLSNCNLTELIGRALVISEQEDLRHLGAGIIARASTINANEKKICLCSGKTIWEERNEKRNYMIEEFKFVSENIFESCEKFSKLDNLLIEKWEESREANIFRYKLYPEIIQKKLIGKYIIEYNENRNTMRRIPDIGIDLSTPYDKSKFNFNKISENEILFRLSNELNEETLIIINDSPFEYGCSLMIMNPKLEQRQIVTKESLRMAIYISFHSSSLKLGFNSLGACASINHLHWHLFYLNYPLYLETVCIKDNVLKDWPVEGFAFEFTSPKMIDSSLSKIMAIVNLALKHNHSHNIFIIRSKAGVRVFLWIRKLVTKMINSINVGFCELGGLILCKNKDLYDQIDEEYCDNILKNIAIKTDQYKHLLQEN